MRRALSVAINAYPRSPLRGCINDSWEVQQLLQRYGFAKDDIALLHDGKATGVNIAAALRALVSGAKKGDLLVWHYSGHGSQVDNDANPLADNGKEDIICPYDVDDLWGDPFTGHKIADILKPAAAAGATLVMLMDCCHSGHIDRDLLAPPRRDVAPRVRDSVPRFLPAPSALRKSRGPAATLRSTVSRDLSSGKPDVSYLTLFSGCQDAQTSADAFIDGDYHGAFTTELIAALQAAQWRVSWSALWADVLRCLANDGFDQQPNLLGPVGFEALPFLGGPVASGAVREESVHARNSLPVGDGRSLEAPPPPITPQSLQRALKQVAAGEYHPSMYSFGAPLCGAPGLHRQIILETGGKLVKELEHCTSPALLGRLDDVINSAVEPLAKLSYVSVDQMEAALRAFASVVAAARLAYASLEAHSGCTPRTPSWAVGLLTTVLAAI